MRFVTVADTDVGISKNTNQDSILIKHASYDGGEVLLAVVCDGMGGLSKGELASATVIREFASWFDSELPYELCEPDIQVIGGKWSFMLKDLNLKISEYAKNNKIESMGTTFSGILFINDEYVIAHVGDTRIYYFGETMEQLTEDHTFVAREVMKGNMTPAMARTDKRRNLLLQCVGASPVVNPQILTGHVSKGVYMICSDGLRHEVTDKEIREAFSPTVLGDVHIMEKNSRKLIDLVKKRCEKDNISVVLIKVE